MWRLIPGPIRRAVSWLLGAIVFAFVMRGIGRREGRQGAYLRRAEGYQKTRKKMDDADIVGNDPDAARRWLHERSKQ